MATMAERTTRESSRRALAERVLSRADWVDEPDRRLLEQVIGRGAPPREIAPLMNCSTRTVQRRVRRLVQRLTDPTVLTVMRRSRRWPRATREVARRFYVRRHTLRKIAGDTGMTLHEVRTELNRARGAMNL